MSSRRHRGGILRSRIAKMAPGSPRPQVSRSHPQGREASGPPRSSASQFHLRCSPPPMWLN